MAKEKFLITGGGGRESAIATKFAAEKRIVCAVLPHANPTILDCVARSGGAYLLGDCADAKTVVDFARQQKVNFAFISSDEPLANGVVDALLDAGIRAVGGTKAATRLEWDKIYAMELMQELLPQFTPFYKVAEDSETLAAALAEFEKSGREVVVKPQGLTGGKGVKVMPEHLATYADCRVYGEELLQRDGKVLLTEKLSGKEFTVMGFTDGRRIAFSPACYDYPYRYDGDTGPGTGGMGCCTTEIKRLPFMRTRDWRDCRHIMRTVVGGMRRRGAAFVGVLNGGFFLTAGGVRFMEFNARLGDPEALNVLSVLRSPLSILIKSMWEGKLDKTKAKFAGEASVVKYLVEPSYPHAGGAAREFSLDINAAKKSGVSVFFSAAVAAENADNNGKYKTLGRSRVAALTATGASAAACADKINRAIAANFRGDLEHREDIGKDLPAARVAG